uniref:Uncharacterized protein n=1 Tax=Megaselia scalaris TaxID=36166 RepID=T1GK15_MEGSC
MLMKCTNNKSAYGLKITVLVVKDNKIALSSNKKTYPNLRMLGLVHVAAAPGSVQEQKEGGCIQRIFLSKSNKKFSSDAFSTSMLQIHITGPAGSVGGTV